MKRMLSGALAALTLGVASIAPVTSAEARDHGRHGGYDSYYGGGRGYYGGHHRDNGDAVAAGVIGLALGAVLGAALSAPREPAYAPPPRYYAPPQSYGPPPQSYNQGYYDDDRRYEEDRTCYSHERQWDRYAQRYVTVDIPHQC